MHTITRHTTDPKVKYATLSNHISLLAELGITTYDKPNKTYNLTPKGKLYFATMATILQDTTEKYPLLDWSFFDQIYTRISNGKATTQTIQVLTEIEIDPDTTQYFLRKILEAALRVEVTEQIDSKNLKTTIRRYRSPDRSEEESRGNEDYITYQTEAIGYILKQLWQTAKQLPSSL